MNFNFSDGARLVLRMAREEAIGLQHDYVGTEHILLGLIRERGGAGKIVLERLGLDLDEVRVDVEKSLRRGKATIALGELPYTSRAKKVLELSMTEARELSHVDIGTEHLLLGLLREEKGVAADVLNTFGVSLEIARKAMLGLRAGGLISDSPPSPPVLARPVLRRVGGLRGNTVTFAYAPEDHKPAPRPLVESQSADTRVPAAIFISYRRGDESGYVAGRIYDRLAGEFGEPAVFKDFDSIPLGVDFKQHLEEAVARCSVFLAVISPGWHERLQNERDFVRIEVEAALRRDIPIIPLFVLRATMPEDDRLPPSLHPLLYRNGTEIRPDPDFTNDMRRLVSAIRRLV
jgi:hypothetical protein